MKFFNKKNTEVELSPSYKINLVSKIPETLIKKYLKFDYVMKEPQSQRQSRYVRAMSNEEKLKSYILNWKEHATLKYNK